MSDKRPRCPGCKGLLKHEPADILGPERVKCILCGWELARSIASAIKPPPEKQPAPSRPIAVPVPKAIPAPRPKFGTCPLCSRAGMKLSHVGNCSRCAYRLSEGIDLLLPNQKPGIAAPRGEQLKTEIGTTPTKPETKEITMSKATRGDCPLCKRKNVHMPGPKCSRCYSRLKKGLDVITGKLSATPVKIVVPKQQPPVIIGFNLDVLAAIDEAWSTKRDDIISKLQATDKSSERLRIAFHTMASVKAMGVEA